MKTKANRAVRYLRETLGQTQAQFASMLGVAKITVTCWETGRNRLEPRVAYKINAATGAEIDDLLESKVPVRFYDGSPYSADSLRIWRANCGDYTRAAAAMAKTASEDLSALFQAGARPGRLGNKYRLPAIFESFMNWIQDAAKDFDLNPQVDALIKEGKISKPGWRTHDPREIMQVLWDPEVSRAQEESRNLRISMRSKKNP
jgi:transcriptional regulator with XRE-family HTH domain